MQFFLDLSNEAIRLMKTTNRFITDHQIKTRRWNMRVANEATKALFEELLSKHFRFPTRTDAFEDWVHTNASWFNIRQCDDPISSSYLSEVLDPIELALDASIWELVPESTWDVWRIRQLPHGHLILEKGEDWRALEWMRMKSEGLLSELDRLTKEGLVKSEFERRNPDAAV